MTFEIIHMPRDEEAIWQAGELLALAFKRDWPEAWQTTDEGVEEVQEILEGDENICRAAIADGYVVGWIGGLPEYDGHVYELHPLAVHPDYQGRGIGRALVTDLERLVAQRDAGMIILGSDDTSGMTSLSGVDLFDDLWGRIAAIQNYRNHPYTFYQKLGYQITGVVPDANGSGKPDILMSKRVKSAGA